jgi:hypothetical protein
VEDVERREFCFFRDSNPTPFSSFQYLVPIPTALSGCDYFVFAKLIQRSLMIWKTD